MPAFRQRGLAFTTAVDLWALGQIRPLGERWRADVTEAAELLQRAEAHWLAAALRKVSEVH
jgi:hypothetical protein